jgi:hypothetical protein
MGKLAPILLIVLGLAGGFAGVYFGMPAIRPGYVKDLNARLDSLRALSDTTALMQDSLVVEGPYATDILMLDSLNRMRQRLEELEQQSAEIAASRQRLAGTLDSLSAHGGEAAEIASTLSILEDSELAGVVSELDDDVLRSLYVTASRKNKARLLQAMPPERAGHLIRSLFDHKSGSK